MIDIVNMMFMDSAEQSEAGCVLKHGVWTVNGIMGFYEGWEVGIPKP